jgi:hypothetical protein
MNVPDTIVAANIAMHMQVHNASRYRQSCTADRAPSGTHQACAADAAGRMALQACAKCVVALGSAATRLDQRQVEPSSMLASATWQAVAFHLHYQLRTTKP